MSDEINFDFADHPDISDFALPAGAERHQVLEGFDAHYVDIVDYIVRCTHRIWEERAVGLIYTHYTSNVTMHSTLGLTYGAEAVVRGTLKRLAAFSDYRSFADDVIWRADGQGGFYTSHRIFTVGVNTGHSDFGPPTNRRIGRWVVADCAIRENRIYEEWIASDMGAELRQLGYDPLTLARSSAPLPALPASESGQRLGQFAPTLLDIPAADNPEGFVRALLHNIFNARMINLVREHFAVGMVAWVPGGRTLYGHGDYEGYVLGLLAQFPDLSLTIDHVAVLGDSSRGWRVATRWTLRGTHEGPGAYGPVSGRPMRLLGMTHMWLRGGQVVREWTVFDEYALLRLLHAPIAEAGS